MQSKWIGFRGMVLGSAILLAGALAQAQDAWIPAPHQHRPISIRHVHEDQTGVDSYNWSGYAVTGPNGSVTYAAGSWIVPASTCATGSSPEYASFWVGIDGWSSNSVEQIGTDSDCSNGTPSYYAWFEFYPQPSYYACNARTLTAKTCPLAFLEPGDVISATVTYNNGSFTATITDERNGVPYATYSTTQTVSAARSSAEWIAEAPATEVVVNRREELEILPLADFAVIPFGPYPAIEEAGTDSTIQGTEISTPLTCYATVSGITGPIGSTSFPSSTNLWTSTMVAESSGAAMATPSSLTQDGSSFSIVWESVGP